MESEKEQSDKALDENADTLIKQIKIKLKEQNFDASAIGIHFQIKEIYIQVDGTQEYLEKVEKNIKKLVGELSENTIFEDYSIEVYIRKIDSRR